MRFFVRFSIAAILAWSAYAKLFRQPGGPTLYDAWSRNHRFLLPGIELAMAAWIISGIRAKMASVTTIVLLSAFIGILCAELTKNHPLPCGCMGPVAVLYEPHAIRVDLGMGLVRDVMMVVGLGYIYFSTSEVKTEFNFQKFPEELTT
jgi:hypothetical protein